MNVEVRQRVGDAGDRPTDDAEIARRLELNPTGAGADPRRRLLIAAALIVAALAVLAGWRQLSDGNDPRYTTQPAVRGALTVAVTATGNLEAVNQIEVGSELSGIIATVDADYNDRVSGGQVIATLDSDRLAAQVQRSRAMLAAAEARVLQAQATVTETERAYARTAQLVSQSWKSETELDIDKAAFDRATATLALARAEVSEAQAQLQSDETNLAKATIRSPIDGIVLDRRIEPGQTVAATYQTPHLFTIAEDLTRMRLHVDVDEADVGRVALGQRAVFTVDAYPARTFAAAITEVRFAPQTVDGVVSYEAVLAVDNAELSLRPGMTATAEITVNKVEDALLVPNAALRFAPDARALESERTGLFAKLRRRAGAARSSSQAQDATPAADGWKTVWVLRADQAMPISVRTGASDGRVTEIVAGELEASEPVIIDAGRNAS